MGWLDSLRSFARDERVMLFTIGLSTFGIVSSMITALFIIREDSVIPPAQTKTRYITQDTEDALEVETLEKLVDHPSYFIRAIATKILSDRCVNNPEVIKGLLYGITRPDYDERVQSLRALGLLISRQREFLDQMMFLSANTVQVMMD